MIILKWSTSFFENVHFCSQQYYQPQFDIFQNSPGMPGDSVLEQNSIDPFGMDQQPIDDFGDLFQSKVQSHCFSLFLDRCSS